jgi:hypothetical protein
LTHYHLKHIRPTGAVNVNYGGVFYSLMEALHAAGLANATRGKEAGYYGVEECRVRACERDAKQAAPRRVRDKNRATQPRSGVPPRYRMLN